MRGFGFGSFALRNRRLIPLTLLRWLDAAPWIDLSRWSDAA